MINQLNQQLERVDDLKSADICAEFEFETKTREILGKGTYGKVFKMKSKFDNQYYAVKCIKKQNEKEGFPITSLREIKFLTSLDQENVIKIKQIYTRVKKNKNKLKTIKTYCAMDLMANDFWKILFTNEQQKFYFSTNQIRSILYQCFKGLQYIHSQKIIHRDIKSANILVNEEGIVKIADFGLAKFCPKIEGVKKTPTVVTLGYRAPEVLLTRGQYSFQLDVWSMGCFAVELNFNRPLFKAKDEAQQIQQIFEKCGTPTPESWPEIMKSDYFIKLHPQKYDRKFISSIRNMNMAFDDELLDLLDKIFVLNPNVRLTVEQVLQHPFFTNHDLEECFHQFKEYILKKNVTQEKVVKTIYKPIQEEIKFVI
ncbi:unnamed protein product (macronuclear) [Paramecium tetraurelia]|uniref:Cyclin-dependent kinase 2 homolog n=1 Tax=Paramecium tetraurelia TaxID=5888 RepID=A0CMW5_PARTE|nr:uncharacterized protein GSPATT00008573001 [Paramecium tetraurelia]CAK72132.1 unnamed protein product [Paramecium tetraurelia]|eukprot:XP_001439529.1 hypothetical protein (macronuclear) [Paramecium tetraurelia strain d4-2]